MKTEHSQPLSILLVEDHPLVRMGIKSALEADPLLRVCGETDNPDEAMKIVLDARPDVVLVDLRLGKASGMDVCRQLSALHPKPGLLILTSYISDDLVAEAVDAGADGYLLKDVDVSALIEAIRTVAAGGSVFDPDSTRALVSQMRDPASTSHTMRLRLLSRQENRVLEHLAKGLSNKEIGTQLNLSEKTVKNYIANMMAKLGISRRVEAAALYLRSSRQLPSDGGSR